MSPWPDNDEVINRFRRWLDDVRSQSEGLEEEGDSGAEDGAAGVGLYQLAEQLTALRHEVKLLTKSLRGAEERGEATLLSMQAAIEQFRSVRAGEAEAAERAAKPLVEALVAVDESLERCYRAIERARHELAKQLDAELRQARADLDALYRAQPWWRRRLCRPWHAALRRTYGDALLDTQRRIFDALLEGYNLVRSRLKRAMEEQAILRMDPVGKQVDPNSMTVVEVVNDPSRPPGLVVEEVRPGYYWQGKVFRFAEVKAVSQA